MFLEDSILANYYVLGIALLVVASFVAGFIDSVAGGAGLILLPSLILAGFPPQLALGQEKLISTLGTFTAITNFFKSKKIVWSLVAVGVPIALLGSFAGAKLILYIDEHSVGKIIVFLMPIALLIAFLPKKSETKVVKTSKIKEVVVFPILMLIIGFYDGFFGPGTGSLLIFVLHYIIGLTLVVSSATSKIFNLASNTGAFIIFFIAGKMLLIAGIPMVLASMLGNYIGSHMTINRGDDFIRPILYGMIILLFAALFYKYILS